MIPFQFALRRRLMGSVKKYTVTITIVDNGRGNVDCVSITGPDGSQITRNTVLKIPRGQKIKLLANTNSIYQAYKNESKITLNGRTVAGCNVEYQYTVNSNCTIAGNVRYMNISTEGSTYYDVGTIAITTS